MYPLLLVCTVSLLSGYYRSPEERHPRTLQSSSAPVYLLPSPPLKSSATFFPPRNTDIFRPLKRVNLPRHLNLFGAPPLIFEVGSPFPRKDIVSQKDWEPLDNRQEREAPLGGRRRVISIKINMLTQPHSSCHFQSFCFRAVGWNVNVEDPLTRRRIRNGLNHLDRWEKAYFGWDKQDTL